jgi:hypothetical protein
MKICGFCGAAVEIVDERTTRLVHEEAAEYWVKSRLVVAPTARWIRSAARAAAAWTCARNTQRERVCAQSASPQSAT